jgi:hypothetical protein
MHITVIWNVDSTYVSPMYDQFMIIWHMTNLLAGVSMVDSIVQYVWMTLMYSGWSTAGKQLFFIVIEDSYPWVTHLGVTNDRFWKERPLEIGHQSESSEKISWKCSMTLRSQNGEFEGYCEKHNWTHKSCLWELPYVNALILPHNIDLMHQERNIVESIISMCFDVTISQKITWM